MRSNKLLDSFVEEVMLEVEKEERGESGVGGTVGGANSNADIAKKYIPITERRKSIMVCCFFIAAYPFRFGAASSLEIFWLAVSGRIIAALLIAVGLFCVVFEAFLGLLDAFEIVKAKGKLTARQEDEFEQRTERMYDSKLRALEESVAGQIAKRERSALMSVVPTAERPAENGRYFVDADSVIKLISRQVAISMITAVVRPDNSGGISSKLKHQIEHFNHRNNTSLEGIVERLALEIADEEREIRQDYIIVNWLCAIFANKAVLRKAFPWGRCVRIVAYIAMIAKLLLYIVWCLFGIWRRAA